MKKLSAASSLYDGIIEDAAFVLDFVTRTPIIRLPWLDAPGRTVWAKLENKQMTNSFKVRGAFNAARKIDASLPLVTASAGNHGLALAYVADHLKRKSKIFVPANASEIKLKRLINMGAHVIPVGRDLYEATEIASTLGDLAFISPFSNMDVIRGQGSLAVEILQQGNTIYDDVLVPLGGGGLLAGVSAVFKKHQPKARMTALHPQIFQRDLSLGFANGLSKSVFPTIADGLAVQHSKTDNTADLVEQLTDAIDHIEERDIEIAIAAMLYNEGLLVEGAGAIGIAALINDPEAKRYRGDTLVLVCGGNISTASLMQALASYTGNEMVAKMTGHRTVQLPTEAVHYKTTHNSEKTPAPLSLAGAQKTNLWPEMIDTVEADLQNFADDLARHLEFINNQGLGQNQAMVAYIATQAKETRQLIDYCRDPVRSHEEIRAGYRILIQNYTFLRNSLSWCSASADQSGHVMFFDPAENTSSAINYDRYGSVLLRERELSLLNALGYDSDKVDLLLTSSGQAAFGVLESFLLREKLGPNPRFVTAPYIYFEGLEQIQALKNVDFHQSTSWHIDDIIQTVTDRDADVLFIDPMANLGTLHLIDFAEFAEKIKDLDWSQKWLVVDGTMISGGANLLAIMDQPNHPKILYYESGSKYLQLGMDLQMAGVVVANKEFSPSLARNRRNTGGIMYQNGLLRFPKYTRAQYLSRMGVLTRNAEILHDMLDDYDPRHEKMSASYPTNWQQMGWAHGGGIVSVSMKAPGLNNRACLDFLVDLIIGECRKEKLSLTKGVSFGFSTTRVSAAAAMANDMPPFLRFSIGEESADDMARLGQAIVRSLDRFFATYQAENMPEDMMKDHTLMALAANH